MGFAVCAKNVDKIQKQQIMKILRRHIDNPGPAIPILQDIQAALGFVSPEFLKFVAQETGLPASDLYGIVTFYSQFRLEPLGRNHIRICHGTACHLAGAERVTSAIEHETKTRCGCTSEDGEFSVEKVACIGCCSLAPVITVNDTTYGHTTPQKLKEILAKERQKPDSQGVNHHGQ